MSGPQKLAVILGGAVLGWLMVALVVWAAYVLIGVIF